MIGQDDSPEERPKSGWRRVVWKFVHSSYRQGRRIVITIVGFTVIAIGVVFIATPGPAMVVIPLGLAILAIEFAWARRWLRRLKQEVKNLRSHIGRKNDN